jgi:transcriptional regulator with XRE-family HTH domain
MSEESDPAGIGRVLCEAREGAQVPLREMSRRLGVDHRYLWDIEHARKKPSPRVLRGDANELNLDLEGLETKSGIHRHTVRRTTSRPLTCMVDQEVMLTIGEDGRFSTLETHWRLTALVDNLDRLPLPGRARPETSNHFGRRAKISTLVCASVFTGRFVEVKCMS